MVKKNIYIVEALDNCLTFLEELLVQNDFNVIGSSNCAIKALSEIRNLPIDLILIDNNLIGEKDAIWLVSKIKSEINVPIVFLSNNENPEILNKIDQLNLDGFLTKPFHNQSLITTINIAINNAESLQNNLDANQNQFLTIQERNQETKIFIDQINYISSKGNYLTIHLDYETYVIRSKLSSLLEQIPNNSILKQVHLRFIVNINKVESFNTISLTIDENRIPISKTYKEEMNFVFQKIDKEIEVF